jgi:outer membrane cobalamin receptor
LILGSWLAQVGIGSRAAAQGPDPAVSQAPAAAPSAAPSTSKPIVVDVAGERVAPRAASEAVVPREVLKAAPHLTAADLLSVVPGVALSQHGGEGKAYQLFYRGFDAVHGQDVEVWVGGAPVNDVSNVHGQGYTDLHFVMPEVVRQIRASPGTYDPRQGDFAVAGTLRLDLGYGEPGVTAKATAGQFGARRYFMAYRPPSESDETFAAVELASTDGFGPSRAARRASAIAQAKYRLFERTSARVLATASAGRYASAGVLRQDELDAGQVDRLATHDAKQGGDATRAQLVLDVARAGDDGVASIAPFVVLRSMRLRQNFTGYLIDRANGDLVEQGNRALTLGLTASYRHRLHWFSKADTLEAGVFARTDAIDQSQRRLASADGAVTRTEVDASVRATNVAGYLDANLRVLPRLTLRGGLRVDGLFFATEDHGANAEGQTRSSMGAHLGKKATVEVRTLPGLNVLASYGEGFRSPQARSLADGETAPFTTVRSLEVGLRFAHESLQASVAGFRTWLDGDVTFDQQTAQSEATPGTTRTGMAVDLSALPSPWFSSSLSVTYTRAVFRSSDERFREGDELPYVPQLVVRSDVSFTPRLASLWNRPLTARVGGGLSYQHAKPLPFAEWGHDVLVVDATASLRLHELELGVDAYNLLDANSYDGEFTYASNFSRSATPTLVPARHVTVGAPRTILFTLAVYVGGA